MFYELRMLHSIYMGLITLLQSGVLLCYMLEHTMEFAFLVIDV